MQEYLVAAGIPRDEVVTNEYDCKAVDAGYYAELLEKRQYEHVDLAKMMSKMNIKPGHKAVLVKHTGNTDLIKKHMTEAAVSGGAAAGEAAREAVQAFVSRG